MELVFFPGSRRLQPVNFLVFTQKIKMQCTSFSEMTLFFVIMCPKDLTEAEYS